MHARACGLQAQQELRAKLESAAQELAALAGDLSRATVLKDELVEELTRTQARQREAVAQVALVAAEVLVQQILEAVAVAVDIIQVLLFLVAMAALELLLLE